MLTSHWTKFNYFCENSDLLHHDHWGSHSHKWCYSEVNDTCCMGGGTWMLVSIKLQSVKVGLWGPTFRGQLAPNLSLVGPWLLLSRGQLAPRGQLCLVELALDINPDLWVESLRVILVCTITVVLMRSKFEPWSLCWSDVVVIHVLTPCCTKFNYFFENSDL